MWKQLSLSEPEVKAEDEKEENVYVIDISLRDSHLGELGLGPGKKTRNAGRQDLYFQG